MKPLYGTAKAHGCVSLGQLKPEETHPALRAPLPGGDVADCPTA
ncbi:hypothetical protein [Nodosilinea sp. P-1105]|nr:hypothetical protein [Nodosilinea sp. P-1105]